MKGKVTKDILLRVGQGVMRIPRKKEEPAENTARPLPKKRLSANKSDRN